MSPRLLPSTITRLKANDTQIVILVEIYVRVLELYFEPMILLHYLACYTNAPLRTGPCHMYYCLLFVCTTIAYVLLLIPISTMLFFADSHMFYYLSLVCTTVQTQILISSMLHVAYVLLFTIQQSNEMDRQK